MYTYHLLAMVLYYCCPFKPLKFVVWAAIYQVLCLVLWKHMALYDFLLIVIHTCTRLPRLVIYHRYIEDRNFINVLTRCQNVYIALNYRRNFHVKINRLRSNIIKEMLNNLHLFWPEIYTSRVWFVHLFRSPGNHTFIVIFYYWKSSE